MWISQNSHIALVGVKNGTKIVGWGLVISVKAEYIFTDNSLPHT